MNYSAIILAGGMSSRMGSDKGFVNLFQHPMIAYIIKAIQDAGITQIIIVSNNPDYKIFGLPVVEDLIKYKGPLGGIHTGLINSNTDKNLILSCDIPFISKKAIKLLLQKDTDKPITVVKYNNRIHHLIGIYNKSLISSLEQHLLDNKLKVKLFNEENSFDILELSQEKNNIEELVVTNINTKVELNKIENEMRGKIFWQSRRVAQ